ncbi:hypothetical protein HPB48_001620 [Haemaphysalis longicornis]|uniref:Uncharacterized protein n=1 Tax=Haemaphysalis longicornis TaxID=44386 RepID=A0A9J6F6R3_HAELO|nr:hypothetical protein HPB48_001620 [Haemaphysalis longicornis]
MHQETTKKKLARVAASEYTLWNGDSRVPPAACHVPVVDVVLQGRVELGRVKLHPEGVPEGPKRVAFLGLAALARRPRLVAEHCTKKDNGNTLLALA